ncbi:MAG: hypothetical protein K2Q22_12735, partial [Cytophagales bacterium]|nr:hypothetical protein [Cytophagales bacterium]
TPYTTNTVRTLYFKTLLEANEMTYMEDYSENLRQKIHGYEEKAVRGKSDGFSYIFKFKGKVIYGFFNRKNQTFNLIEF